MRSEHVSFFACAALLLLGTVNVGATHPLPGPHFLNCEAKGSTVHLSWDDLGIPADGSMIAILERDGDVIADLVAGDVSFDDVGVPDGSHVYRLIVTSAEGLTSVVECQVVVGDSSGLACSVDGRVVTLEWKVADDILALGFVVTRDGRPVATLGPDARSYREEAPPGEHAYTVSTDNRLDPALPNDPPDFLIGSCRVVVEAAGAVECAVDGSVVTVRWEVLDDVSVRGFVVSRDGVVVAQLGPEARSYREEAPPGEHVYTVATNNFPAFDVLIGSCRVVIEGGLGIRCSVNANTVAIEWDELPIDVPILGFAVRRDGEVVAELGPDALSYREEAPPGEHTYAVVALSTVIDPATGAIEGILVGTCKVRVGDPGLPPPRGLQCVIAESAPIQVQLFWENPVRYDSIAVERDNQRLAVLEGTATRFSEFDPGPGLHVYAVYGMLSDGDRSPAATCAVELGGPAPNRLLLLSDALDPDGQAVPHADTVTAVLQNADPVQAWSFGVGSDPSVLTVADSTIAGTAVAELNEGEGPTFLVLSQLETGVTMAAVIDEQNPAEVLPPASAGHSLLALRYEPGPDAVPGEAYPVVYTDELGVPPVAIVVVVDGFSVRPATSAGVVIFAPTRFVRGDGNNDGQLNMSDGVFVLDWLFRGGPPPGCMEAADANGTREVNIADPVYIFQALFIGGPPPPAPFPDCGPAALFLGCEASVCDA